MENDENCWNAKADSCSIPGTVKQITWGALLLRNPLLAVNCVTNVYILHKQPMSAAYSDGVCICQLSPTQLLVEMNSNVRFLFYFFFSSFFHLLISSFLIIEDHKFILKTDIQVQYVAVNKSYVVVSSGRNTTVYKISNGQPSNTTVLTSFNCDTEKFLVYDTVLINLTSQVN